MALRILIAALACSSFGGAAGASSHANPIRKVVTMLQKMSVTVTEEGKKEEALYEKFICYCKTNVGVLQNSIAAGKNGIESDTMAVEAAIENKKTTQAALKEHTASRNDGKAAMDKATAIRGKEAGEYAKFEEDSETNIAALGKALAAVSGGMGSFLQTTAANSVRNYVMDKANMADETRHELLSFLSGSQDAGYAPASGEIVGILDQLKATMESDLRTATATENASIESFDKLMATKTKEVDTLQAQVEKEMQEVGDLDMKIAEMKDDLGETAQGLLDDQKFVAELQKGCQTKAAEWDEVCKTRQGELVALADTVKILNDDDTLDLFKKTLPGSSASLVQIQVSSQNMRSHALALLRAAKSARPELDLIEMALNGKQMGFEKVLKMVDSMSGNLKAEQADDDDKKAYCEKSLDEADDNKKLLEGSISDSEAAIEAMTGALATLAQEIAALQAGVAQLDKAVADATAQRKEESDDFEALISSDTAAKEILMFAKNRLNKFYNPKLYKPPAKEELSSEDRIVASMGAAVLAQVSAHKSRRGSADVAPPPPPETFGAYSKKSEEGGGVIAMIDLLVHDLDKEMQIAKTDEKNAQEEYGALTADAGDKRKQDSKALTEKSTAKANAEEALENGKLKKKDSGNELMGVMKEIYALHGECDWLMKFYDARTAARTGEIDALTKAKAVLSGADYSLLQTSLRR